MANNPSTTAPAQPEERADRFKRVAGNRTAKALDAIRLIGGTANKQTYEYTPEQVKKITDALEAEMAKLKEAFAGRVSTNAGFEL